MIELGEKYKDSITGIKGTATAITNYLFGCRRVLIECQDPTNKAAVLETWLDEQRLTPESKAKTGGPGPVPTKRSVPR